LRDPLLGWLCVPLAKEVLGRTPKSKTSSLMMARALSDAGEAEAAGKLHAEVFKANYKNPVMWREVAYAGQQPGYATSPELMQRLMQVTLSAEPGNSQLTRSYSAEQIVKGFEAGGHDDMAKQTRLMQWLTMPHLRPCTDADLALITAGHLPQDACSILDQVLSGPHPCDRSAVRSEFYRVANQLAAADQKQAQQLVAMARGQLKSEGAFGEIVHFLMSYPSEAEPVDASELLLAHLEMIATARDNADYLNQTLDALTQEVGIIECSRVVENTLDNYPTSLPMWTVRAALNARIESEGQGLDDLRTVLTHAQSPRARMRFLTLAAAERRLSPADTEQWQKLPKDLLKSPEGAYLRALMALRQGKADKAVELFADGAPQYDGRHLFELALAHLESTAEDGVESACAALTQLQKDYPNSLLAQNAGSFLRQLSPRP
jgi:TolA-binding protein